MLMDEPKILREPVLRKTIRDVYEEQFLEEQQHHAADDPERRPTRD